MYTLYSIDPKNYNTVKIRDGGAGELRLLMNSLKNTNKGMMYALYRGHNLLSSMLNK